MALTSLKSHCKGATRYIFDNGNEVSVVFGAHSYTPNHDLPRETKYDGVTTYESNEVEIMVSGDKFVNWFVRQYDGNPAGYLSLDDMQKVLKKADSRLYARQS